MTASVKDVAALAGVSSSTVSNYLNHPHLLGQETRERVRGAVEQLRFVPNESARQLRAGSSRVLALILLDAWLPYFNELSRGVEDVARERGWSLFFSNSGRDVEQELRNIEMFEKHRVQGVIISPLGEVVPRLELLADRGIRSVTIGPAHDSAKVASVAFDDRGGGRLAGEHLRALGRDRIAFIGDPERVVQTAQRLAGLEDAIAGSDTHVRVIPTRGLSVEDGLDAAASVLALPADERPNAVFATNDMVAIGVLTGLLRGGVSVPGDVALIGFDDIEQAHQSLVPLTSVRQPGYALGRAAAEIVLQQIAAPDSPPPAQQEFPAELIVRESTVGH